MAQPYEKALEAAASAIVDAQEQLELHRSAELLFRAREGVPVEVTYDTGTDFVECGFCAEMYRMAQAEVDRHTVPGIGFIPFRTAAVAAHDAHVVLLEAQASAHLASVDPKELGQLEEHAFDIADREDLKAAVEYERAFRASRAPGNTRGRKP